MAAQSDNRWLTLSGAACVVIVLLVGAAVLGAVEQRTVPADAISLNALPTEIGGWTAIDEQLQTQPDNSHIVLRRTYQSEDGHKAYLTVQATYTRAGSLRDWSLAMMADGWTPTDERIWSNEDGSFVGRLQRLENGREARIAVTWYSSAHSQSASFKRAQVMNWWERLQGRLSPWASLYLVMPVRPDHENEQCVTSLASAAGKQLQYLLRTDRSQVVAHPLDSTGAYLASCLTGHSQSAYRVLSTTSHNRKDVSH